MGLLNWAGSAVSGAVGSFFYTPSKIVSTDIVPDAPFNPAYSDHTTIIDDACDRFRQELQKIKNRDNRITYEVMATALAFGASVVINPFAMLTFAAIGFYSAGAHEHGVRTEQCRRDYRIALNDLIRVHAWATENTNENKLNYKSIQRLILTLGPWVPPETIMTWKEDDLSGLANSSANVLENRLAEKLRRFEDRERMKDLSYLLYGDKSSDNALANVVSFIMSKTPGVVSEKLNQAKSWVMGPA